VAAQVEWGAAAVVTPDDPRTGRERAGLRRIGAAPSTSYWHSRDTAVAKERRVRKRVARTWPNQYTNPFATAIVSNGQSVDAFFIVPLNIGGESTLVIELKDTDLKFWVRQWRDSTFGYRAVRFDPRITSGRYVSGSLDHIVEVFSEWVRVDVKKELEEKRTSDLWKLFANA
jgi:hypothetical protein